MSFPTSSALIEFLILAILEKDDSYGYEISQTIKLIANIKESTLYPILHLNLKVCVARSGSNCIFHPVGQKYQNSN